MKHLFLIGSLIILTACSEPRTRIEFVTVEIPEPLLKTCDVEARQRVTLVDVGLIIGDHVAALDCANGKIEAIAEIVNDPEPGPV